MLAICQENLCISFLYQIMANVKIISTTEWLKYNKTMSSKLSTSCPQNPFEILFCKRSFRPAPKLTRSSLRDLSRALALLGSLTRPARGLRMLQRRISKGFCSVVISYSHFKIWPWELVFKARPLDFLFYFSKKTKSR